MITFQLTERVGIDIGSLIGVLALAFGYFSQKFHISSRIKKSKPKKQQAENEVTQTDVSLFLVFVLNRLLLFFCLYVLVKLAWLMPIRETYPQVFLHLAYGVGGYIGGITFWIFDLSRKILKEANW